MKLGEMIKSYRVKTDLTMQEFANKAGLSKGYVSMLEKNQHPQSHRPLTPSLETYQKVASAMSLSLDELISILDGDETVSLIQSSGETVSVEAVLSDSERQLLDNFRSLNPAGQSKASDYLDDLVASGRYAVKDNISVLGDGPVSIAAHKRTDIEVTDEMLEHDMKIMLDDDF